MIGHESTRIRNDRVMIPEEGDGRISRLNYEGHTRRRTGILMAKA